MEDPVPSLAVHGGPGVLGLAFHTLLETAPVTEHHPAHLPPSPCQASAGRGSDLDLPSVCNIRRPPACISQ